MAGRPKGSKNKPKVTQPNNMVADTIECKEIRMTSGNGKVSLAIRAYEDMIGLWISENGGGPMVAIYNGMDQGAVVGVYNSSHERALNIGICGNKDGGGLQLCESSPNPRLVMKSVHEILEECDAPHIDGDYEDEEVRDEEE